MPHRSSLAFPPLVARSTSAASRRLRVAGLLGGRGYTSGVAYSLRRLRFWRHLSGYGTSTNSPPHPRPKTLGPTPAIRYLVCTGLVESSTAATWWLLCEGCVSRTHGLFAPRSPIARRTVRWEGQLGFFSRGLLVGISSIRRDRHWVFPSHSPGSSDTGFQRVDA